MNTPIHPRGVRALTRREFVSGCALGGAAVLAMGGRAWAQEPKKKLGVALVGLGNYSRGELGPALRKTELCELRGVVTGDPAKGAKWAKDYGFSEKNVFSYETMDRMKDNSEIDIVYVVTPNGLHAEHAVAAAEAGKHVICEKPMANTVEECDLIMAACKKADVRLSVGYRLHFDPYHAVLRELVRTGEFGPFMKMNGSFGFRMDSRQWRIDKKLAGGGPLMDLGIYVVQESCMASTAPPIAVTAQELKKDRPDFFNEVEEAIKWKLEFPNGAVAEGFTSYNGNGNDFRSDAKDGWFEMTSAYGYRGLRGATSKGPLDFSPPVCQQALQMDDFADCINSGRETTVGGDMGRRDMAIIGAIYASAAADGKRVEIKL